MTSLGEGSCHPGSQAHMQTGVLEVQLPREEGRKDKDVKEIVPNLNPTILSPWQLPRKLT